MNIHTRLIKVTRFSGDHRVSVFILRSPFTAHLSLLLLFVLSISEALIKSLGGRARKCGDAIFPGAAVKEGNRVPFAESWRTANAAGSNQDEAR